MALQTYLQSVNKVLRLLRADEVSTVDANAQSRLIGAFINEAKRVVEDSYNWNALTASQVFTTSENVYSYTLTDVGQRFKVLDAYNTTTLVQMRAESTQQMNRQFMVRNAATGAPYWYNFNGMDTNGDPYVNVYPKPDATAYVLQFNLWVPQEDLSNDSDTLLVPADPVVQLAYAKALVERGEDGGVNSSEAYAMFEKILSDYIAIESARYPENERWEAT